MAEQRRLESSLEPKTLPPDFTYILPTGEVVKGRVWHITESQVVTNDHTFSAHWVMQNATERGHSLRWVLIEDLK